MRRKRAVKAIDGKIFSKTASMVHKRNLLSYPMRGGIRL